jgi:hypothetical protein
VGSLITLTIAVASLWLIFGAYFQMNGCALADAEIGNAIQKITRDFALIGLGMPNNRKGRRSFAAAFSFPSNPPVMAFLGSASDPRWGGPVTVANANPDHRYDETGITGTRLWRTDQPSAFGPGGGAYVGPELYYVFAVPTGVRARFRGSLDASDETAENRARVTLSLFSPDPVKSGGEYLRDFRYDGRNIGLQSDKAVPRGKDMGTWLLFPTLKVPMLLRAWSASSLVVEVAPGDSLAVSEHIMGLDEVHLIQAARLYRNGKGELTRTVFGAGRVTEEVLARDIAALWFVYNPVSRLLTIHVASRERKVSPAELSGRPPVWPSWLPPFQPSGSRCRVLVKSVTWRMRN